MKRYVFMELRLSNKDDFTDLNGNKKIGAMYFEQSVTGAIHKQPRYITEVTDLKAFKELYTNNQIYVTVNIFEPVEIVEEEIELTTNKATK